VGVDKYMGWIDLPSSFLCSAAILAVFMTLLLMLRREGYSDGVEDRGAATKSKFLSRARKARAKSIIVEGRATICQRQQQQQQGSMNSP
jgi:hypothetical protein